MAADHIEPALKGVFDEPVREAESKIIMTPSSDGKPLRETKDYDILLISPLRFQGHNEEGTLEYGSKFMPLGIMCIASFLDHEKLHVRLIDCPMNRDYLEQIDEAIDGGTKIFGLSVMTVHLESALEISAHIKARLPEATIIWGGIHPQLYPEMTARNHLVDYVVYGEGEHVVLELIRAIQNNDNPEGTRGIAYQKNGKVITNPPGEQVDIMEMPFFNYELLGDVEKYVAKDVDIYGDYGGNVKRVMPILTALGCPYKCSFCLSSVKRIKYRAKSVDRILAEIDYLVEKYNAEYIRIEDEIFFLNKKKVRMFLDGLRKKPYKILWWGTARAHFFEPKKTPESMIAEMKELGCYHVSVGVESGSPRMIKTFTKGITLANVEQAAKMCDKYGFQANYPFILGAPHEEREDAILSLKFANRIKQLHPRATMIFHSFRPHPGAELYDQALDLGWKAPQELEDWIPKSKESIRGYCPLEDLPWVEDPEFIEYLTMFGELAFQNPNRFTLAFRIPAFFARNLFKLRLRFDFWHMLIEYRVYKSFKKRGLFTYIRKVFKSSTRKRLPVPVLTPAPAQQKLMEG